MRKAVNGLHELGGGTTDIYDADAVDPVKVRGQVITAAQWTSLMTNLSNARVAAQLPSWNWTNGAPAPLTVTIKAQHLNDLRNGVK